MKLVTKYSPNLWLVNFHYIRAGLVKELEGLEVNPYIATIITDDGIYLMNKFYHEELLKLIPYFQFIMGLTDDELEKGLAFKIYMHKKMPKSKRWNDQQIQAFIKYYNWEIHVDNMAKLSRDEIKRRKFKKGV